MAHDASFVPKFLVPVQIFSVMSK